MGPVQQKTDQNRQYEGQFIAYSSPTGDRVIASGSNSGTVIDTARKQGVTIPTVVFVPKRDSSYLY